MRPHIPIGDDAVSRQACTKAWTAWAQKKAKTVDLSRAHADLPPFNPALRARDVGRQFFNALIMGDLNAFQKAVGVPFLMTNENVYQNPDDLNNYFNENPMGLRNGQFTPAVLGTVSLEEYVKTATDPEKNFVRPYQQIPQKRSEVVVLLIQQNQIGVPNPTPDPTQGILFVVRL